MRRLSADVFQALLAIGWLDGQLDPDEAAAIFAAAADAGLSDAEIGRLRELGATKVEFGELQRDRLSREDRRLVYAAASFVARVDATVTSYEQSGLNAVGAVLGLPTSVRRSLDRLVEERRAADPRLDLRALKQHIDGAMASGDF